MRPKFKKYGTGPFPSESGPQQTGRCGHKETQGQPAYSEQKKGYRCSFQALALFLYGHAGGGTEPMHQPKEQGAQGRQPGPAVVCQDGPQLIRRLTPLECERLQGFPDGWTDIPHASDSARYKALGNSVAIPCVDFVLRGIALVLLAGESMNPKNQ